MTEQKWGQTQRVKGRSFTTESERKRERDYRTKRGEKR